MSFPLTSKLTDVVRLLAPARDGAAEGVGCRQGLGGALGDGRGSSALASAGAPAFWLAPLAAGTLENV